MQAKFVTAVLLSFVLITASACGGGGSDDGLKDSLAEAEAALEAEKKLREEAEKDAAEAEEKRQKAQADADKAAEAERKRQEAEEKAEEAERQRQAAEAERKRLADEAEKAQREAAAARSKAAFDALGGGTGDGLEPATTDVIVMPTYGQTATVTTTPAVTFESKRRTSSGRWSITTLSNDDRNFKDDLVVYSDIGGPTHVLFTEHPTYSTLFTAVENTNNIVAANLTGNAHPIASSRFPGGGRSTTFDHTIDSDPGTDGSDGDGDTRNDYDTTRFSGTFAGASGTFECTGTCTVAHQGASTYNLSAGTWSYTTSKTARAPVPDSSYMYFGWWKREPKSGGEPPFEMFSGGQHAVADIPNTLTGTATYTGAAVGQYAIYQPLGTQNATGSFTARAELTANFGSGTEEGMLSGRITNFSNASDWSVTLKSGTIDDGAVADGDVSWTIAGNTADGGEWDAKFFSDVSDYQGHIPEGVAGTFDAKFADVGRMIGAFGAHCPTSTCPRN